MIKRFPALRKTWTKALCQIKALWNEIKALWNEIKALQNNLRKITQVSKINKSVLKGNKLQHGHNIAYLQISQAGLPICVLLLSGNNCLLYLSIGISFKSIKNENKIRTVCRLTGIAWNQKKSWYYSHLENLSLHKLRFHFHFWLV